MLCTGFFSSVMFISTITGSHSIRDADSKIPVKSKFACEDGVANIVCPSNTVIEIISLFYGRNPDHGEGICSNGAPQGVCEMTGFDKEEKLNNLKKACNSKSQCNILASDLTFGDRQKCPKVTKYLNIIYKCPLPSPPSTKEPSTTKEPVYYTGTSVPGTSTKPTTEPYIEYHKLDEDGKEWPTPRPIIRCNTTTDSSDDEDLSSSSSAKPHVSLFLVILIWKLFV